MPAFALKVSVFFLIFSGMSLHQAIAQSGICIFDSLSIVGSGSQITIFSDSIYFQNSVVKGEGILAIDNNDKEETVIFSTNSSVNHLKIIQSENSKVNLEGDLLVNHSFEMSQGILEVSSQSNLVFSPNAVKILGKDAQILYRHEYSWQPIPPLGTTTSSVNLLTCPAMLTDIKLTPIIPFFQTLTIDKEVVTVPNASLESIFSPPEI